MDRLIEVKINGMHLTKDNNVAGVQHEANATVLRIEFDPGWDDCAKKVTFWNALGTNPVERTLTADLLEDITKSARIYLCPIPGEAMTEAGKCKLVVDGWISGKRQRSIEDTLKVKPADFIEQADQPVDPTPTQAEQLQQQVDILLGDIQKEAIRAETARTGAETAQGKAEAAQAAAETAKNGAETAQGKAEAAQAAAEKAKEGVEAARDEAKTSETNAKASETAAKTSETNAKASEEAAKSAAEQAAEEAAQKTDALLADKVAAARKAEANAKASENAAKTSETNAKASETAAKTSEADAKASETAAKAAETAAKTSESSAASSASSAASSEAAAETAKTKAEAAQAAAEKARNEAEGIVGGDYISRPEAKALVDQGVSNANEYTDRKIAAIPAPDVSGQIQAHDANHTAHGDIRQALAAHEINRENPHGVTAEQAGAAPAAHVNDAVKHITAEERTAWNGKANEADLSIHTGNKNNPHNVTAEQVGAIAAGAVGNLYVWKKEKRSYTIKLSSGVTGQISINGMNKTIQYSYQIYMVGMKVALKNPVTLTYPDEALNGIGSAVKGNYLCVPGGKVYFAEYYEDRGDYLTIGCKDVTLSYDAKTIDYLTYKTASVYPYDDEVDGYHYTYLGQLGAQPSAEEIGAATTQDFTVSVTDAWDAVPDRGYSQRVSVSGIESSDNPIIDVVLGSDIAANALYLEAYALVTRVSTSNGAVTLWCDNDTPTVAFTIQMKVVR